MSYEVENKYRVADFAHLERWLAQRSISLGPAEVQIDHYFNHPARDFARTDEAFRLRCVGPKNFLTYKGPKLDTATKTRRELELPLPDGSASEPFAELFVALGFRPVATVRKQRRRATFLWRQTSFELALDELESIGRFAELETVADLAGLDAARDKLLALADELALGAIERLSYLELVIAGTK